MSDISAEPLSPLDAATLWPQLRRLSTEVIATRHGDSLLLKSGLAAAHLTSLPKVRRTMVMGMRRGLGYRGVLIARELSGGVAWEVVSLRLARDTDDEAIETLLAGTAREVLVRSGHTVYLRYAEGSPHETAIRRGGFVSYVSETLFAPPPPADPLEMDALRDIEKSDAYAVFRLYCQSSPEPVRRHEAPTFEAWGGVHDAFDVAGEFVADGDGSLMLWVGLGEREGRMFIRDADEGLTAAALNAIEAGVGRSGTLVAYEYQEMVARAAIERGYTELGTRMVCARSLAISQTLAERVAVSEPRPIPQ
jgi:hypothetical protein